MIAGCVFADECDCRTILDDGDSRCVVKALIVIPAYNEEKNLRKVIADIQENCPEIDYVIVNDGSTDGTANLCRGEGYNSIELVSNLGFSGAVQTGFKYAKELGYESVVQLDGDGQHPASAVRNMLDILGKGEANYVIGSRFCSSKRGISLRSSGSRFLEVLIWLRTGKIIHDPTSGLRAVGSDIYTKMARNLNFVAEPDTVVRAILNGAQVKEMQVNMRERVRGVSHFRNPLNILKYMLRMTVSILLFQGRNWQ